jgi:hypothetical protein
LAIVKRKTAATEPQPTPIPVLRREGRLARIAKALAAGATVTDIAEAEGISRTIASRNANSTAVRARVGGSGLRGEKRPCTRLLRYIQFHS